MTSAAFTINGTSVPRSNGEAVATTYGATVTLALSSIVGANSIQWSIVGVSGPLVTTPTITRAGVPLGATATFAVGSDLGEGDGVAYGVRCRVTDGAGQVFDSYGVVGARNSAGIVPAVAGEGDSWRHPTQGWTPLFNKALKGEGSFNVLNFGADPTGVADSTAAFQAAIDAAEAAGGGEVTVPAGTYLKPGSSPALVPKSNVTIRGVPGASVIQLDATGVNPIFRSVTDPFSNFHLRDLVLDGGRDVAGAAYSEYGTNPDIYYGTDITVVGCTIRNMRTFGMGFNYCTRVTVDRCRLLNINRDGCFCWYSTGVKVVNSNFEGVNDDAISCHHGTTNDEPVRSDVSIENCSFYRCQGPKVLGPKVVTIKNNRMRQMMSTGLWVACSAGPQGDTVGVAVLIDGNIFQDVFGRQETPPLNGAQYYMRIGGILKNAGGAAAAPGVNDTGTGTIVDLFGTGVGNFWTTNTDDASVPGAGAYSFVVSNNIFERTLPAASAVADWGGAAALQVGGAGEYSGAIPESALTTRGIVIVNDLTDCLFLNNTVRTTGTRAVEFYGFASAAVIPDMAFNNLVFRGNTFKDFSEAGMYWPTAGSTVQRIIIDHNTFDADPRHVNAARNGTDGSWTAYGNPIALRMGFATGKLVRGNTFRNVAVISQDSPASNNVYLGNMQCGEPAASGFSTSNKGIGTFEYDSPRFCARIEDSDPTSATYGQILNECLIGSTTMPSAGSYVRGHFTYNYTPTLAGGKVLIGWSRLTTGSNHVANTDWSALYCTNT